MRPFALILLTLALATAAPAQTTSPHHQEEPPAGPLLASAPDFSNWTVLYTYPDEAAHATPAAVADRVKSVLTLHTGDLFFEQSLTSKGQKVETWHVGSVQYRKFPGAAFWAVTNPASGGAFGSNDYTALPANGFRGLSWPSAANYIGTLSFSGQKRLVFAESVPAGTDLSKVENWTKVGRIALVDLTTRLPVQVMSEGSMRLYEFKDPPTEKLTLPDDLQEEIKKGQQARASLSQRAGRPY